MPFQVGGTSIHNDGLHNGNAKRGTASGLASLNASSKVVEEPASKGQASGLASLNASSKVVEEPASKGQASGLASLDASSKVVEEPASKGVANGIASLGATALLPDAQNAAVNTTHIAAVKPHSGHAIIATGNYTGNGTNNRAIAHGLGVTPKFILCYLTGTANEYFFLTSGIAQKGTGWFTPTAPDSTNFYVGDATYGGCNYNAIGVNWVAIS